MSNVGKDNIEDWVENNEIELWDEWLQNADNAYSVWECMRHKGDSNKIMYEFDCWCFDQAAERLQAREPEDDPDQDR